MNKPNTEIELRIDASVATLTIARVAKRNALGETMWLRIESALDEILELGAKVLRIEGAAGVFSSGADVEEQSRLLANPDRFMAAAGQTQRCLLRLQRLPIATLAVIDGDCLGSGLGLALACDLRIASRRSHFALAPARLGLACSVEECANLVAAVGAARAKEMLFTGRNIDAHEASSWGLVHRVVEVDMLAAAADATAKALRTAAPSALAAIKLCLAHLGGDTATDRSEVEAAIAACFGSRDFAEGASAFLERRAPQFGEGDY